MLKKFTTILLLLSLCLISFAACAEENDTPEGYQLIANEGDRFRLYVPTKGWMPNTTAGTTGAFFSGEETTSINVYKVDDAQGLTLDEYWTVCNQKFSEAFKDYQPMEGYERCNVGGQPAQKYVFTAKISQLTVDAATNKTVTEEIACKFMLVMVQNEGETYLLIYSAPEDKYETHLADMQGDNENLGVLGHFRFDVPYASGEEKKYSDKVTAPEGMKLISTDELPYRFFVPTSWTVNQRAEFPAASPEDSGSANVMAHMYMIGGAVKPVADYFADCEKSYKELFESYHLDEGKEITMDGVKAMQYTYTIVSGGVTYRQMQAIVLKGEVYYTVTYTALPEEFDTYLPEVEKMIESFDIR